MPTNPGTTGLVSWWALGEASGNRVDSHSTNHLSPVNAPGNAAGTVGNAVDLASASSQYLTIAAAAQTGLGSAGSFTFGAWYLRTSSVTHFMCSKRDGSGAEFTMTDSAGNPGTLHFYLSPGFAPLVAGSIPNNSWTFIVVGYNAATGNACSSINGAVPTVAARTYGGLATAPFNIGYDLSGGLPQWDGRIDEAFYYTGRWLTDDELSWLYNAGAGRSYADLTATGGIHAHAMAHLRRMRS